MKCYEIIEKLETLSPPSYAEEWDAISVFWLEDRDKRGQTNLHCVRCNGRCD